MKKRNSSLLKKRSQKKQKITTSNDDGDFFYHLKGIVFYSDFSKKIGHFKSACLVNNEKWYYFDDNTYETDKDLLRIYENENPSILFYEK